VFTHVRIARSPEDIHAIRVSAGKADLVLGCDLVVSGAKKVLTAVREGHTIFLANTAEIMPGEFARSADFSLPVERLKKAIRTAAGDDKAHFFDATRTATSLFGNSLGANMFMLGFAFQHGGLPLSAEAVERAIELNGEAVAMNIAAFRYGRRAAIDPDAVEALVEPAPAEANDSLKLSESFREVVARREAFLTAYQSRRYARRYRALVDRVAKTESEKTPGMTGLAEAVARYLFKLMAYKDEYEVARLYTDTGFLQRVRAQFDGDLRFEFHLAPPMLEKPDPVTGEPKKRSYGPRMLRLFGILKKFRFLRGTPLDPFGYSDERRTERKLIVDYRSMIDMVLEELTPANHAAGVALASIPEKIRGFGPVKQRHLRAAKAEEAALLEQFKAGPAAVLKAAE